MYISFLKYSTSFHFFKTASMILDGLDFDIAFHAQDLPTIGKNLSSYALNKADIGTVGVFSLFICRCDTFLFAF